MVIAAGVTGSEVRLAAPAVPPASRVSSRFQSVLLAGIVGLLLGIFAAFALAYLGLSGEPGPLWGKPEALWNRVFRWVLSESPGLPPRPQPAVRPVAATGDPPGG